MDTETVDSLITGVLSGNVDEKACQTLQQWMHESLENRRYFETFQQAWLTSGVACPTSIFDVSDGFRKFTSRVQKATFSANARRSKTLFIFRPRVTQMAAVVALVCFVGSLFYHYYKLDNITENWYETTVPLGSKSQIILTDGTKVWLNAGSRLSYSTAFASQNRRVLLEGEGYFEVATNPDLPFEVKTSLLIVRAIGTSFNVKAYPNDSTVETILVEGKLEVSREHSGDVPTTNVLLQPNQRLTLVKNTNKLLLESHPKTDNAKEAVANVPATSITPEMAQQIKEIPATSNYMTVTSWKDKRWYIDGEKLESLAVTLERRYNVQIRFTDNKLKEYRFNGTLEDEPIEAIMKAMAQIAPINYTFNGAMITLSINKKFRDQHKNLWMLE
ncbi:MAG: FecR family protein [Prevotellaceae bacterium]|jgi:ferric-dicitrate binding protein FerR (iron transport regulator)|nr:FecR family protein [Prevotellaceae bacterium]